MKKTRFARRFYDERHLPAPRAEYWPESSAELRALLEEEPSDDGKCLVPRIILGEGQQVRTALIGERTFDVIRTGKCNKILSLDTKSGLARVESGTSWRDLQRGLADEGWSLARYGLYPSTGTIGGLLSQNHMISKDLFYGDIREGCVALTATSPTIHQYRYIPAPRKASGPDMRYLFIGGEGLLGAILDATMVMWKPSGGRLFRWKVEDARAAAQMARKLFLLGVRPAWCHYDSSPGEFSAAVVAPEPLLDSIQANTANTLGEPHQIGDKEAMESRRRWLEDRHPARRSAPGASETLRIAMSLTTLADGGEDLLAEPPRLEIHQFSSHRALVYATFEGASALAKFRKKHLARFLEMRTILGDDPVVWHPSIQALKRELDESRLLAIGP
ncbi:MAG: FAD-binding oxidoreductase [Bradymonadaceae bacterium]